MKIILSRKSFDSNAGGVPSPILPDGRMVSFPHGAAAQRAFSLSCHDNPQRWSTAPGHVILDAVPKGQEFVLDTRACPEALNWSAALISQYSN